MYLCLIIEEEKRGKKKIFHHALLLSTFAFENSGFMNGMS
jgi:hypothetical protein